jgi:hypothetical protein
MEFKSEALSKVSQKEITGNAKSEYLQIDQAPVSGLMLGMEKRRKSAQYRPARIIKC